MNPTTKYRLNCFLYGTVAILGGAAVIHFGDRLLGVNYELFYGISTFSPLWLLGLFFVPFLAGMVVSFVYGLGGKILAYFPAILVRGMSYMELNDSPYLPEGATLLPLGYWMLIVIVAVEAAAIGGVIGEIVIKKTYGRTAKHKIHKKYKKGKHA